MKTPRWYFAWSALALFAADQASKLWIYQKLFPAGDFNVIPGFLDFTFVRNDGIAFGMLQGNNTVMILVVFAILGLAVWWSRDLDWRRFETNFLGALVLGGAAGNLADRFRYGYVVDFIDANLIFMRWPAFNVADAAVSCSMAWIILRMLCVDLSGRRHRPPYP